MFYISVLPKCILVPLKARGKCQKPCWDSPCMLRKPEMCPLQEQQTFLTAEVSLQHLALVKSKLNNSTE